MKVASLFLILAMVYGSVACESTPSRVAAGAVGNSADTQKKTLGDTGVTVSGAMEMGGGVSSR